MLSIAIEIEIVLNQGSLISYTNITQNKLLKPQKLVCTEDFEW